MPVALRLRVRAINQAVAVWVRLKRGAYLPEAPEAAARARRERKRRAVQAAAVEPTRLAALTRQEAMVRAAQERDRHYLPS